MWLEWDNYPPIPWTLEIDLVEEKLWWNTRKKTYYATFAQFAAANQLDYDFITNDQSVNVVLENPLDENDYPCTISLQMLVLLGVLGHSGSEASSCYHKLDCKSHIHAKEWQQGQN